MLALERTDFNTVIVGKAEGLIEADRRRFLEVYRITEEYCKKNEIIVSSVDDLAREMASDTAPAREMAKISGYSLHCTYPYKHAVNLANLIHSNVGEWVKMRTIVGHQEFVIEYDMRALINIYSIDVQKNVKLRALIMPVKIDGLLYMSPEIEIIDVYHRLYSPDEAEDWGELVELEGRLYDMVMKRVKDGVFGGGEAHGIVQKNLSNLSGGVLGASPDDRTDIQYLKYLVLSEFCGEFIKDYVVVGHWAMHVVEASRAEGVGMRSSIEKIQVVTAVDIGKAVEDVGGFLGRYTNARVVARVQDLHIPKDFRINRYTVYVVVPSKNGEVKEKAFMDIFNCGNFELIPYIPVSLKTSYGSVVARGMAQDSSRGKFGGRRRSGRKSDVSSGEASEFVVKIGNPYVLLRFLIIDLWIIRMIHEMGHLTYDMLKIKTKYILHVVEKVKSPEFGLMGKVFGVDYVGVYKDYDISKKIANLKGKPFYPYYPEREVLSKDEYKRVV